jgi:pseudoazurin
VNLRTCVIAISALGFIASPATAREWRVAMVNRGANGAMDYTPAFLRIAPGDTVRFVAQDKTHNAESIRELTPAGGTLFKGSMNKDVLVKFSKAGLYGYKCLPHLGMGMVGLVQVGSPVNKAAFNAALPKLPPLARSRMSKFLSQAK